MRSTIKVGTRPSPLALRQVEEIRQRIPHINFDCVPINTKGDNDKITPLAQFERSNFFTHEIERALLDGRIDAAVHSAKDIEDDSPAQLVIACVTRSISPLECLVSRGGTGLSELPAGSVIGTSSSKRKSAIARFREDLVVRDIRGNIDERLKQLDKGDFDAVIVAHAALLRLGYEDRITEIIPLDIVEPHPLQGRLAVQVRHDRDDVIELFRSIHEK